LYAISLLADKEERICMKICLKTAVIHAGSRSLRRNSGDFKRLHASVCNFMFMEQGKNSETDGKKVSNRRNTLQMFVKLVLYSGSYHKCKNNLHLWRYKNKTH